MTVSETLSGALNWSGGEGLDAMGFREPRH